MTGSRGRPAGAVTGTHPVLTGADRVALQPGLIPGRRIGLATNGTGVVADLRRTIDAFREAGVPLHALFGPEHGLGGSAQAGCTESRRVDITTGLPVFETYLASDDELDAALDASGIDTLVFDMQDIGVRFYTYVWTLFDLLRAAARTGRPVVVLDRPNPIGGAAWNGPGVRAGFESFVGRCPIPIRHGLTIGELARHFATTVIPERDSRSVDLAVIEMTGWSRGRFFGDTGLPWVPPSPNMPTVGTALAFAGFALFEGTTVSEGRGTTTPFETIGAPYIDERFVPALRSLAVPGAAFRAVDYVPTFHKYAGQTISGTHVHVTDRARFDPIGTALAVMGVLIELYPGDFAVLDPDTVSESGSVGYALDRLWGSSDLRICLAERRDPRTLLVGTRESSWHTADMLLYP
jgi:uncharacterized protein YbbC (DUF1343 family)